MSKNLWDKKKSLTYIKLGSFFLIALFIFFITLLSLREVNIFEGTYTAIVKFEFVEGLRPASPVRFCGVDVGEVKGIVVKEEEGKPLVYVTIKIQKDIKIPKESSFFVNSLSLFGEKYLEINPPSLVTTYINDGDTILGQSPESLFSVISSFAMTLQEVRDFVKESRMKGFLENILVNIEDVSLGLKGLIEDMRNKEGTFGKLLYDDSLYKVTEEFIQELKEHPWKLLHKPKERRKK